MQRQKISVRILPPLSIKIFDDLSMDFAFGFRVICTSNTKYTIKLYDNYTNVLHHTFNTQKNKTYYSDLKFFIRWKVQVYKDNQLVYQHLFNLKDKIVIFEFSGDTLGDTLSCISILDEFQKKHECKLFIYMNKQQYIDILKDQYSNLIFTNQRKDLQQQCYAYYLFNLGNIYDPIFAPYDFRIVGIQKSIAYLLHIDQNKIGKTKLNLSNERKIRDKYVVINTSSSSKDKQWLKQKWIELVKYLHSLGYIVYQVGIDDQLIDGCIDLIGKIHLQQRIDLIHYADMFIGLSSGLAWTAYYCNIPVVMLCTMTFPTHQFYTKYRVQPIHGCRGCIHSLTPKVNFYCLNKEYPFECRQNLTVKQVCNTIDKVIKDNY